MRLTNYVTMAMLVALPFAASAYTPSGEILKDYLGLTRALRANGVDPARVNWGPIATMCMGLRTERDDTEYNRCRYTQAMNQTIFVDDQRSCNVQSQALYSNRRGAHHFAHYGTRAEELFLLRDASYTTCMRDLGWRNTQNWQMGRAGD